VPALDAFVPAAPLLAFAPPFAVLAPPLVVPAFEFVASSGALALPEHATPHRTTTASSTTHDSNSTRMAAIGVRAAPRM
jgi:hypothetical protein